MRKKKGIEKVVKPEGHRMRQQVVGGSRLRQKERERQPKVRTVVCLEEEIRKKERELFVLKQMYRERQG